MFSGVSSPVVIPVVIPLGVMNLKFSLLIYDGYNFSLDRSYTGRLPFFSVG